MIRQTPGRWLPSHSFAVVAALALTLLQQSATAAEPSKESRPTALALRHLYEACRTRELQTGRFPTNFRDLDGIIDPAIRSSFPLRLEFWNPDEADTRLKRSSPMGDRTPCLRVEMLNGRWLNVANTGWIYESGLYWESEFVELLPCHMMDPAALRLDARPIPARLPARSPKCGPDQIDLAPYCNAAPTEPWFFGPIGEKKPPQLAILAAKGVTMREGILYDVHAAIQVEGALAERKAGVSEDGKRYIHSFPWEINNISVRRPARHLHLLAGCVDKAPPQATTAWLRLHFDKGEFRDVPLVYGRDISAAADPTPAPERIYPEPGQAPDLYSLHHVRLDNPLPDETIDHIDFRSSRSPSHPYILSLTLEP